MNPGRNLYIPFELTLDNIAMVGYISDTEATRTAIR